MKLTKEERQEIDLVILGNFIDSDYEEYGESFEWRKWSVCYDYFLRAWIARRGNTAIYYVGSKKRKCLKTILRIVIKL